ncbi:hypothetical protein BPLS_P5452 [Bathymodiolus platifrons methanotrophic gill symbiont]|uniref:hypothetical protein n=1 Tax=Bathymodiolus platifrons methanotrophic gill symbiont TaxID=113268 RepID=UPI001B499A97|nr:hypothetical protein [Bathymodiolus platifrons methanotrophic gill symbiont]GFO77179.1 hypothetical protein BPLS_P5452 [Bathymodiolus platifrons methanotrophic gill symbiont]
MNKIFFLLLIIPNLVIAGNFIDRPDLYNLSCLNARYLNHITGRFLTQDSKKQFYSHYLYGDGRVILYADPSGNMIPGDVIGEEIAGSSDTKTTEISENISPVKGKNKAQRVSKSNEIIKAISTVNTDHDQANYKPYDDYSNNSSPDEVLYHHVKKEYRQLVKDAGREFFEKKTRGSEVETVRKSTKTSYVRGMLETKL